MNRYQVRIYSYGFQSVYLLARDFEIENRIALDTGCGCQYVTKLDEMADKNFFFIYIIIISASSAEEKFNVRFHV